MRRRREHIMRLAEPFFTLVERGEKTVEIRLADEKRREISYGDRIVFFSAEDDGKAIETVVANVRLFEDFYTLASSYTARELGFEGKDAEHIAEFMNGIYGERAKSHWAMAIELYVLCEEDEI